MTSLETIRKRMLEQDIHIEDDQHIVIPIDELRIELDGSVYPGRIFAKEGIIVSLQEIDDNFSETGFIKHPVIWRIMNTYETWLNNGSISYRTEFYVIE